MFYTFVHKIYQEVTLLERNSSDRVLGGSVLKSGNIPRIRIGARLVAKYTCSRIRNVPKSISGSECINGRRQNASTLALAFSNE